MKIPLLIVEDGESNIQAAKDYFATREEFEPDFARTKEEALEKLVKNSYSAAICDVNIPEREGYQPDKYGPAVAEVLDQTKTPFVYLTTAKHGENDIARIFLDDFSRENMQQCKSTRPKNDTKAWEDAIRYVGDLPVLEQITRSKARYERVHNKPYEIKGGR